MIVHRYITHVLDKKADEPILNDFEGRISLEVDKFLQNSIKKVKKEDCLRKAKFNDFGENVIRNVCDEIIHNEDTFVENSKEIAAYLFDVMKASDYIESCDLIICLITDRDEKYVAIIKVDYKKIYNHSVEYHEDKFNIQIVENEIGIAETFKPKQCALIGVNGLEDEYDLRVIDIEAEKNCNKSIFIEKFINARKIIDDTYKTSSFIHQVTLWINSYFTDVNSKQSAFNLLVYVLMNTTSIDIDEFADRLIKGDKEAKESFIEDMSRCKISNFNVNKKIVEKRFKKIDLDLVNFKMKCRLDDFNNINLFEIIQNGDKYDLVIKNIGNLRINGC